MDQEFKLWSGPVTTNALAVRHYGPRAERMLSQMLLARDSTLILKLRALAARQKFVKIQFTPAAALQAQALTVCECLDAEVKGTVPAISKLLADYPRIYKDANLADEALSTLALMGPDGGRALAAALGHPDASIRRHAAELLATAPVPATDELIAALQRAGNQGDLLLRQSAARAIEQIQARRSHQPSESAKSWLTPMRRRSGGFGKPLGFENGLQVTAASPVVGNYAAECLFGKFPTGNPSGVTIFADGQPDGFAHWIEWETPAAQTIKSFGLLASQGPAPVHFQRALRGFRLFARTEPGGDFRLVYSEDVPVPYGQGGFGLRLLMFRNLE